MGGKETCEKLPAPPGVRSGFPDRGKLLCGAFKGFSNQSKKKFYLLVSKPVTDPLTMPDVDDVIVAFRNVPTAPMDRNGCVQRLLPRSTRAFPVIQAGRRP